MDHFFRRHRGERLAQHPFVAVDDDEGASREGIAVVDGIEPEIVLAVAIAHDGADRVGLRMTGAVNAQLAG